VDSGERPGDANADPLLQKVALTQVDDVRITLGVPGALRVTR
jgi:hypothetical protein